MLCAKNFVMYALNFVFLLSELKGRIKDGIKNRMFIIFVYVVNM